MIRSLILSLILAATAHAGLSTTGAGSATGRTASKCRLLQAVTMDTAARLIAATSSSWHRINETVEIRLRPRRDAIAIYPHPVLYGGVDLNCV